MTYAETQDWLDAHWDNDGTWDADDIGYESWMHWEVDLTGTAAAEALSDWLADVRGPS